MALSAGGDAPDAVRPVLWLWPTGRVVARAGGAGGPREAGFISLSLPNQHAKQGGVKGAHPRPRRNRGASASCGGDWCVPFFFYLRFVAVLGQTVTSGRAAQMGVVVS